MGLIVFAFCSDEAHNIKNRNTKSALACCDLEGKFRWCLTGTPMYVLTKVDFAFDDYHH